MHPDLARRFVGAGTRCVTPGTPAAPFSMNISIKTPDEQQKMRVAGRLAADVLDMIGEHVRSGDTTAELDQICHDFIVNV